MSCLCNQGMQNLGLRACDLLFKETVGVFFVPTYANDGNKNKILAADTLNEAYFLAKVNETDPSKRWYPIMNLENVKDVRAADELFTAESGAKFALQDGLRSFEAKMFAIAARMISKLASIGCNDVSVYRVDRDGAIVGKTDGTDFYPCRLAKSTFQTLFTWATSKTPQDITMMFDFHPTEKDEDLRGIRSSSMANVDLTSLPALLDVTIATSAISATGFTATLKGDEDEFGVDFFIEGFVKADFELTKAGSPIAITSATETSPGVYIFVVPTATGSHVLAKASTKTGYEIPTATVLFP